MNACIQSLQLLLKLEYYFTNYQYELTIFLLNYSIIVIIHPKPSVISKHKLHVI